jgi:hypothetical protein
MRVFAPALLPLLGSFVLARAIDSAYEAIVHETADLAVGGLPVNSIGLVTDTGSSGQLVHYNWTSLDEVRATSAGR